MENKFRQACDDLMLLVWRVKFTMFNVAESYGLTPVQLFALYAVSQGATNMGRVAEAMHCDASNVTGVVDRLVSQGLIIRSEDAADRRAKRLAMTEQGGRVMRDIVKSLPDHLGCARLSDRECDALHTLVGKLKPTV